MKKERNLNGLKSYKINLDIINKILVIVEKKNKVTNLMKSM